MLNRSDAIDCLRTGAEELNELLANGPDDDNQPTEVLVQRWMNKVVGAGMDDTSAALFLAHRLAEQLRETARQSVAKPEPTITTTIFLTT